MMLNFIIIFLVIFLILTFFYKQSVCEFRINQIEWVRRFDTINGLLSEKVPIILRGVPKTTFWTCEDVMMRNCYSDIHVFKDRTLAEWISVSSYDTTCPWNTSHSEKIGGICGLDIWSDRWITGGILTNPIYRIWLKPFYECWAGNYRLKKMSAPWNCIIVSEGAIQVSLLTCDMEYALPKKWEGCFPMDLTSHDTPFVTELKILDIIVKPGNCLMVPAHWFVSWKCLIGEKVCPMVCMVSYHSPLSRFAKAIKS